MKGYIEGKRKFYENWRKIFQIFGKALVILWEFKQTRIKHFDITE